MKGWLQTLRIFAIGFVLVAGGNVQAGLTAADVFKQLKPADRERLAAGDIITVDRPEQESDKTGLAIGLVVIVPADPRKTLTTLQTLNVSDDPALRRTTREITGVVGGDGSSQTFAAVGFAADENDEAKKLLAAKPGEDFNFSDKEYAWIRAAGDTGEPARSAAKVMRRVLESRYLAYQQGGLDALPPYARENQQLTRPGAQLAASVAAMTNLQRLTPEFFETYRSYPRTKGQGIKHQFYWEKKTVEGRPMFSLRHEMAQIKPEGAMIGSREFYINSQLNVLQVAIALIPHGNQTLAVLVNETYTDKIADAPRLFAAPIGRKIVESNTRPLFEKLQKALGRARSPVAAAR